MSDKKNTTEYFKKWQNIKLSEPSRARMEEDLLAYARFHSAREGVRIGEEGRSIQQVPTRTSILVKIINSKVSNMTALLVIALVVGGGTSYAAEGSLPGEFLYPVKVEVNENIKSALAFSSDAEARLQARLAEERLEEAEALAARGELSAETASEIGVRLRAHYEEAASRSTRAETEGDFESSATVRAELEGSLRAHTDILTYLNTNIEGNNGASLISDIELFAGTAGSAGFDSDVTVSAEATVDIEALIARSEALIARVETKLEGAKDTISATLYARAEARLEVAKAAHADAEAQLRADLYREAYTSIQAALSAAYEVEAMAESMILRGVSVEVEGVMEVGPGEKGTEGGTRPPESEGSSTGGSGSVDVNINPVIENSDGSGASGEVRIDASLDEWVPAGL